MEIAELIFILGHTKITPGSALRDHPVVAGERGRQMEYWGLYLN